MLFDIPAEVNHIICKLEQSGFEAWLVGGCVRDFLMGIIPEDYDICTSALPEQITPLFEKTIGTGIKHGTITVILNHYSIEVTTFRVDSSYTDHRRPDSVIFSRSLTEDLKRRDFTINAIAYHPAKGFVDPYNGQKDITDKIIRTVGNPIERFKEDSLRMLRAIRFKARFNLDIHIETKNAIGLLASTIEFVSNERVLAEVNKILTSPHPEAFLSLFELGLIQYIFPVPIPSVPDMTHFSQLKKKLSLRWSALLWLMGFCYNDDKCDKSNIYTKKNICNSYDKDSQNDKCDNVVKGDKDNNYSIDDKSSRRDKSSIEDLCGKSNNINADDKGGSCEKSEIEKICHKFKMSNSMVKEISTITGILDCRLPSTYYSIRLMMSSTAPDLIFNSLSILRNYRLSIPKIEKIENAMRIIINNKHCIRLSDLALDGNDLINNGLTHGKTLGQLLEMLFLCVLQKPVLNRKDILLDFAYCISSKFYSTPTH
ncbi:MAG: hypothetical protein PHC69_03425 [Ruminiclostridium sp.]|nr:hypothetical protein [Ruminiclostridium sp.]